MQMVQKGSWTINYDGRYPVIDTDGLTYMVDGITLKTNDSETYYLDVIKKEDYTGSYKSSPYTAASAHLAALKKAGVQPSSGDSETYFDIGDEGGVDWIALAFGVNSTSCTGASRIPCCIRVLKRSHCSKDSCKGS